MNANDIRPAVIMAMAAPSNGWGMSAAAKRSRIAENKINTSEKPVSYTHLTLPTSDLV